VFVGHRPTLYHAANRSGQCPIIYLVFGFMFLHNEIWKRANAHHLQFLVRITYIKTGIAMSNACFNIFFYLNVGII
jgi:hypothetical protein